MHDMEKNTFLYLNFNLYWNILRVHKAPNSRRSEAGGVSSSVLPDDFQVSQLLTKLKHET